MSENFPLINWDGPGWYCGQFEVNIRRVVYRRILTEGTYQEAQAQAQAQGYDMANWYEAQPDRMIGSVEFGFCSE